MSNKPPGFGSPPPQSHQQWNGGAPKYINDFTKALAGEVRILLEEVGKLRDERRALQTEIAELMALKARQGSGGDYSPSWGPPPIPMEEPAPPPPEAPPAIEGPPEPARPGWRTVYKKKERVPRAITAPPPATPAPAPAPIIPPDPPAAKLPAWAQWRPSPQFQMPTPRPATPATPATPMSVPPRAGLFGPATPPP